MKSKSAYDIAVIYGDGVGPEVCGATVDVLKAAFGKKQVLNFIEYQGGAATYLETGSALPVETFEGCTNADAILHGAAGLPSVVYPDGTEAGMDFGLPLRFNLDLYANVRYIKLYKGTKGIQISIKLAMTLEALGDKKKAEVIIKQVIVTIMQLYGDLKTYGIIGAKK